MDRKRGQLTIFIIIAIVIVAAIVLFFIFKDSLPGDDIPASIQPVYVSFLSCLEEDVSTGIDVLESQGGYIELPEFEAGSAYMPFSSQLDFLGNPIPYWYYVSGNNIQKEQIPTKQDMENQLEDYIEEEIRNCYFGDYYEQEFEIEKGVPEAEVKIRDNEVGVTLYMNLVIRKAEDNVLIDKHEIDVSSKLGSLYASAKKIYEYEQESLFLEDYGVDIMRLYAPVDGVELTCSPLTWNADEVFDDLQEAIEANTMALKVKGEKNDYFLVDVDVEEDVMFLNSKDWAHSFEVTPSEQSFMMANAIGNHPGMGILGFCYVPYHFVYDIRYPVLVQVYSGEEIFQFPLAVVIKRNRPREAMPGTHIDEGAIELCSYKNTLVRVNTYDKFVNPIDTDVAFECLGTRCEIGKTLSGTLKEEFPQCANGLVLARAEGYKDAKYLYSTTSSGTVDIFLDKLYEVDVALTLDRKSYNKDAIVSFISEDFSRTIVYPNQRTVELSEGQYDIHVYIYKNSSLKLEGSSYEQCVETPRSDLGGLFGLTEEKCFDIEIPSQIISNALAGGGKQPYYILESELMNSEQIEINSQSLPAPRSIEQLQENYILFEDKGLGINFK